MGRSLKGWLSADFWKAWEATDCDIQECSTHLRELRKYCESRVIRAGLIALGVFVAGLVAFFLDQTIAGAVLLLVAFSYWQESARHKLLGNVVFALWPIALLVNRSKAKEQEPGATSTP